MRLYNRINELKGIVQKVSKDKTQITLSLPKGGKIKARNEGFEIGDQVCFILNSAGTKIIKVLPKLVADITVKSNEDPLLNTSLIERPNEEEASNFEEYKFEPTDEVIIKDEEEEDECGGEIRTDPNERKIETKFTDCNSS
jgi:hypothetical protein